MKRHPTNRREFLTSSLGTAATVALAGSSRRLPRSQTVSPAARPARIRFAAIGLNHSHINGQVETVIRGGGQLVSFFAKETELVSIFAKRFPDAKLARSEREIRPAWFFERQQYGGILCDLASHNLDAFLFLTGSTRADVIASQAGNVHHPTYPGLEDFGDVMLSGNGGAGYIRVDWFTPAGLKTYGDSRLTILGTEGYIELRKTVDIAGRPGANHLFLVDHKGPQYVDCSEVPLPYAERLVDDIIHRTNTADSQARTFLAVELALEAQKQARRLPQAR